MPGRGWKSIEGVALLTAALAFATGAGAQPYYAAEELVEADGAPIIAGHYAVPIFTHWNEDGLPDLIIGEGCGEDTSKLRVYLNSGTISAPIFTTYSYAQSQGGDLTIAGGG